MSSPKVSIIAPVYGVEKYIPRAVDSILAQTYTEWELFLVDDGSKDNSGAVCDEYALKDSRINVIHKENGGAPSARNVAIDKATGKYMFFMDPDDWAEPKMLEDLVATAERDDAQLVVAGFYIDTYYFLPIIFLPVILLDPFFLASKICWIQKNGVILLDPILSSS